MKIGFIGLGTMGAAMATNLVKAGYTVVVWNRSPEPVQTLVAHGAIAARSPLELAKDIDVLINILANDEVINTVIDQHVLASMGKNNAIHINMATISVEYSKKLAIQHAEHNVGYIAAPVLGRLDTAISGKLNILAAGNNKQLQKIQPILDILGEKTWYFGDKPEQANAVKLAANFLIMCVIESLGESFALVEGYNIASKDFLEMITNTLFSAPVYKNYGSIICDKKYSSVNFKLNLGLKDARLVLDAGEKASVPLPFAGIIRDNYIDAIAQGNQELDWSALAQVAFRRAGQLHK